MNERHFDTMILAFGSDTSCDLDEINTLKVAFHYFKYYILTLF